MKFSLYEEKVFNSSLKYGKLSISTDETAGFKPLELFISSMIGCSGTILVNILKKKRIPFSDLHLSAEVERDEKAANRISKLFISAVVQSDALLSSEQTDRLSELVIKNCGMLQTISESVDIRFLIKISPDIDT